MSTLTIVSVRPAISLRILSSYIRNHGWRNLPEALSRCLVLRDRYLRSLESVSCCICPVRKEADGGKSLVLVRVHSLRFHSQERGNMDLAELTLGEKLVGGGAIALLIGTFLPWYGSSYSTAFGSGGSSANLWNGGGIWALLIALGCVVAVGVIVLRMMGVFDISEQGVEEPVVVLAAAAVAMLITIWKVLQLPGGASSGSGEFGSYSYGRQWGLYIALIGAVVFTIGAVMKFQEER